jgi:hypothetical protein|tara:strand:+ start:306 stop:422 length:117 start_codon:yes stop_codon:yes gene_type:complete
MSDEELGELFMEETSEGMEQEDISTKCAERHTGPLIMG